MFVTTDDNVKKIICCSFCKNEIKEYQNEYKCFHCGLSFPKIKICNGSEQLDTTHDFRIHRPDDVKSDIYKEWESTEDQYEKFHKDLSLKDDYEEYLAEIDSVKEIYTDEFNLSGSVLDVGGHQGRLRHYLSQDVNFYISIDPLASVFDNIYLQKNLLKAFPSLNEPCYFLVAHAEQLPIKPNSFDWIHMRSVVDHFYDPYIALLEAFRCAKCRGQGNLLIGLAIMEKYHAMHKQKTVGWSLKNILKKTYTKANDDHMFRLGHKQLHELCKKAGWRLVKEHWQKEPFSFCLYAHYVADKN